MKYFSLDIETTGLNENTSDILQIALVYDDLSIKVSKDEVDEYVKSLPSLNIYVVPENNIIKGDIFAINMNQEIINKINEHKKHINKNIEGDYFLRKDEIPLYIRNFIVDSQRFDTLNYRINLAGKNLGTFDLKFCEKHIPEFNNVVRYRHRIIDPAILYLEGSDEFLPNMETCFKRAGIKYPVAHNALDDALDTIKLIRYKLTN